MLKEITDLRQVWPHEAMNFTPWLAEEENMNLLGDFLISPVMTLASRIYGFLSHGTTSPSQYFFTVFRDIPSRRAASLLLTTPSSCNLRISWYTSISVTTFPAHFLWCSHHSMGPCLVDQVLVSISSKMAQVNISIYRWYSLHGNQKKWSDINISHYMKLIKWGTKKRKCFHPFLL